MMTEGIGSEVSQYYIRRRDQILHRFDEESLGWWDIVCRRWGSALADSVLRAARQHLDSLVPMLPDIGGDENHLTGSLIGSALCLAFFRSTEQFGKAADEAGRVLYEAAAAQIGSVVPPTPSSQLLDRVELMRRRRERAERSQQREYSWDWVYEFVEGDGETFDYGYDFLECATTKFYHTQGAHEFLPFYCFLDFPKCEAAGLGLTRTMTLAEGFEKCDFRFKEGGKASQRWPPLFLSSRDRR